VLLLIHYSEPALIDFLSAKKILPFSEKYKYVLDSQYLETSSFGKIGNAQDILQASDPHMKQWNN
jgi:hypothetical protein